MRCFLLLFAIVPCVLLGQTKMSVEANGARMGSATFDYTLKRDRSLDITMSMSLAGAGAKMTTISTVHYDRSGTRTTEKHTVNGAGLNQLITVAYTGRTATVAQTVNGKKSTKKLTIPAGQTFATPSVFWFITTKPKVGQKAIYWLYDPNTNKLEKRTVQYVSTMTMKLKGKDHKAHFVKSSDGTKAWVDDKCNPLRMEYSAGGVTLVMVRE